MTKEELLAKGLKLIPASEVSIELDPSKTEGGDFTVEDYYTFSTYDGIFVQDCMAVYFPITDKSTNDVVSKIAVWNNLISPSDMSLVTTPSQDIVLGIWSSTTADSKIKREIKGSELPVELYWFNQCLPDDYPLQTEPCDGKKLKSILNDIAMNYPPAIVMECLDRIKSLGIMASTLKGYTLSINDLYNEDLLKIAHDLTGDRKEDLPKLASKETMTILKSLPFSDYIESGARGSWDQCKQLVLSRGYVSDVTGKIRENLIRSSLVEGLTQEEFFDSSWGARKGLLDTATSTGDSGYLTRQLVYSTVSVELDDTLDDCGTTDGIKLSIPAGIEGEKMLRVILWRYIINDDGTLMKITKKNHKQFLGKNIVLRSPVFCTSPKVCKKCYGELHNILHSNQIGIIATQSIGERITQLVLRSFHTSGVAQTGKSGFDNQEDVISGIGIANKLFHKPDSLGLETPEDMINMMYKIFNPYKSIHMVHYEIIVSAMMINNERVWRTLPNRAQLDYELVSIMKIPAISSWVLGVAFANLKSKLINSAVKERIDDTNSISRLFEL